MNTNTNTNTTTESAGDKQFFQFRSMHSMGWHLGEDSDEPLCGITAMLSEDRTVTRGEVIDSIPNQHAGWYWCPKCAAQVTGMTPELVSAPRR